jgi:truncated hemoglobin YjbI
MTLYEKLGGEPAVTVAVDRFYVHVLQDPLLAPFFQNAEMVRLKRHQLAFLSQALGGPQRYSGVSMAKAHERLHIEQRHFDAVAGHLVETLRELGVGAETIDEVVGAVAPLAKQIVNTVGAASA